MDTKHNRPLLLERRRHRLTEENRQKVLSPGDEVFLEGKSRKRAYISSMERVRIRRVIIGMLLCVKITSVNRDATLATIVNLDTEADGQLTKQSKKSRVKG